MHLAFIDKALDDADRPLFDELVHPGNAVADFHNSNDWMKARIHLMMIATVLNPDRYFSPDPCHTQHRPRPISNCRGAAHRLSARSR